MVTTLLARFEIRDNLPIEMTSTGERVFYSMVIGFLATGPFYALEYYYSGGYPDGVPSTLFRIMWIETTLFSFLGFSICRTTFASVPIRRWMIPFLLKVAAMIVIAIAWVTIVIDQMPCFFGGGGC